jgi:hypothetical protein
MEWILVYFDIEKLAVTILLFSLVIWDFTLTEYVYKNMIFELFSRNEVMLHSMFKYFRKILEGTLYKWIEMVTDIFFSLLSGIIPKLPSAIATPLEFIGVTKYLEARMDKYKYASRKKQEELDYREYSKQIEQNRPESPTKSARIERKDSTDKGEPIDGATKEQYVYDPATKQFKMVTKQYDSASKSFITASPPQVIGTKKKDKEPMPITPRGGGTINMKNFTKPQQ